MGTTLGVVAAVFLTLNHAIFRPSLFMAAGIIDTKRAAGICRVLPWACAISLPINATLAIR